MTVVISLMTVLYMCTVLMNFVQQDTANSDEEEEDDSDSDGEWVDVSHSSDDVGDESDFNEKEDGKMIDPPKKQESEFNVRKSYYFNGFC